MRGESQGAIVNSFLMVLFVALSLGALLVSGWMSVAVFAGVMILYFFLCWLLDKPPEK